ncbi:MAG: ExbD/TolR family protein [Thermoanaerobaculia bacterium]
MSPNPKPTGSAVRSEINVTPLVDVCLVLLIIFMVVTPMIQAGVKVDLPKTAKPPGLPGESNQLAVSIQEDGTVWVRGVRTSGADLRGTLAAIHAAEPDKEVIVRGDRHLQYEKVTEVLTTLNEVGFARVGLITERAGS